jgi:CBS domain-containing membrane protein
MTESKTPEGEASERGAATSEATPATMPTGGATSDASSSPAEATAPEAPGTDTAIAQPAAATASAAAEASPDDEGRESIEVEALDSKPQAAPKPAGTHRPPPPPSIRASGGRWHFDVSGRPKLAQDLMTRKIFTIGPNDKLLHLEEHMEKFRFGHLPVVEDDKLVGLITHADLLHASASFLTQKAKEIDEIVHNFPASRIMQKELITVRPTDTLADVAKLMWEGKVGCVLVTDENERLVGIITEGDFIRLAHHFLMEDQK